MIVDNVALTRLGTSQSIIVNGDFEDRGTRAQQLKNTFVGWIGNPSRTNIKNGETDSQASLIGPTARSSIKQTFRFDREARYQTKKYTLSFDYAATAGAPLTSAAGTVSWNGQQFPIQPTDHEVHKFEIPLTPIANKINVLSFKGHGKEDGFGLTVSNVKLLALGSVINMVLNEDFNTPVLSKDKEVVDYLPGWNMKGRVELGKATFYNPKWVKKSSQVLNLDSTENVEVTQEFNIGEKFRYNAREAPFFTFSFDYAAIDGTPLNHAKGELLWNDEVIASFRPDDRTVHQFRQAISLKPGKNVFDFRAKLGSVIAISNFNFRRVGLSQNMAENGNFGIDKH